MSFAIKVHAVGVVLVGVGLASVLACRDGVLDGEGRVERAAPVPPVTARADGEGGSQAAGEGQALGVVIAGATRLLAEVQGRQALSMWRLDNGLTVVVVERGGLASVAYQTWFRGGSRLDPEGRVGTAHLLEHLMFREVAGLADGGFDRVMEAMGSEAGAVTWLDYTNFGQRVRPERVEELARIEAARMRGPVLREATVASERAVLLRERAYRIDQDPHGVLLERLYASAFGEHPYGRPAAGRREDIGQIAVSDLEAYARQVYHPANALVVIVGPVRAETLLPVLVEAYGVLPKGHEAVGACDDAPLPELPFAGRLVLGVDAEVMVMAYPAPPLGTKASLAMQVLNVALFAEPFGVLTRLLTVERAQVSEVNAWVGEFACRSLWEMLLHMRPGVSAREVRRQIHEVLREVAENGLDEALFLRARKRLVLEAATQGQDAMRLAEGIGQYWVAGRDVREFLRRREQIEALGGEDVREVARRYLGAGQEVLWLGEPAAKEVTP